ncbi:MAG: tryptophan--tRNA ligase, partial [Chloroflexi bacterium]|nr:tryptophan--tRNA ligase [Chloroflexota bacterium]
MVRVFSGIQPSGDSLHLGNYLGAIVGMLELQEAHQCIF